MQHQSSTFRKRFALSLTAKIVLLVSAVGIAFALISAYATRQIQRIEVQYRALLQTQSAAKHEVGMLYQYLSDASTLIYEVLTTGDMEQAFVAKERLHQLQQAFDQDAQDIQRMTQGHTPSLEAVTTQAQRFFAAGHHSLDAYLQWNIDRPLHILAQELSPTLRQLRHEMESLRQQTDAYFEHASRTLIQQTQHTLSLTNWTGWLSVLLIFAYAAWLAWHNISLPLRQLTHSMQRMSRQEYHIPIHGQERHDEIGTMARTLQGLNTALQQAQALQAQLQQQQQKNLLIEQLQALTSALPGAVFQVHLFADESWQLRFVSPQWTHLMGLEADADHSIEAASHYFRHYDQQVMARIKQHFLNSAKTLQPVNFEVSMQMLDGVNRWIKTRANPHVEADGSIVFNGVWLDVTKEVIQAQALNKAKRQAEQSAAERTAMQAAISHEIRTPLNAILGLTQLLLKAELPQTQREQLYNVLRAGQHLRGIVNEVLDFSKIDAGQLKLESTDFSLETVVLDVLSMCQEEASKKGLTLHYKIAREVPDSLRGDPHRIAQILLNYVNNAIKFTASGHIDITIRLDPGSSLHRIMLHASVRDTGPGIPADHIPLLFEAYQQADNSITRRYGGTGLGLAISRALAQLMGGTVGVQSTVGAGSNFWFTAVLEPARSIVQRTPAAQAPAHAIPMDWQGLRVLVVDDNALNRAVAEGMLHAIGLQTDVAEDGAQALMKLQSFGPQYFSCVLMDMQMPHMNGISATRALRQLPGFEHLPVIAMTAHTAVQDVERSLAAGMNAHLSKPLLESALHTVLQEWLGAAARPSSMDEMRTCTQADTLPPVFDASAMDALAQLFDATKLEQLVTQFTTDTLQRARQLPQLAQQHDWQYMHAEAHKLTGTAATFGLMQLGHFSSALSAALKEGDTAQIEALASQACAAAEAGVTALEGYGSA